ncbi:MAG TPA: ATP-binding cassette domain-containing protein [Microbacterium sp.]|nr:ATP-binding cassette domain-containing protein [Microbacterium sp.]
MIEFDAVTKNYGDGRPAVADFSLTVPSRRITVFVGPSGCGKTTLLRMVNRMVSPSSGRVLIDGDDVAAQNPVALRRSIGYVLQNGGLLPHRTVAENVATVAILNGARKREALGRSGEMLELVGLDPDLGRRYPAQLSGGQQQRVGVARALATDPNVLLMDEPFGAVDPLARRELQEELLRLQRELGKTILFVTHDIDEAFRLGNEVVVFRTDPARGGAIAQKGSPAEILSHPADGFVRSFIGATAGETPLSTREVDGRRVVFDPAGRPLGVIDS